MEIVAPLLRISEIFAAGLCLGCCACTELASNKQLLKIKTGIKYFMTIVFRKER
jgi:hypothetical protein